MSGIQEILVGPSRRWRENALRNLPYMGQTRYLENFPMLCRIRQNINQFVTTRRFLGDVVDRPFPATLSGRDIAVEALLTPIRRIREITTTLTRPREIVVDRAY